MAVLVITVDVEIDPARNDPDEVADLLRAGPYHPDAPDFRQITAEWEDNL